MSSQNRIASLDGIRGIAIASVLIWHYIANNFSFSQGGFILHFTKFTWAGVDLFFVLSGFLITDILIKKKKTLN